MASIFKRTKLQPIPNGATIQPYRGKPHAAWTDGRGRQRREPLSDAGDRIAVSSAKWYITYTTAAGERKTLVGTRDKAATERIAAKLEAEQAEYRHGSRDARAEQLGAHERAPIEKHLADFEAAMEGRGVTAKHVDNTLAYIRAVVKACSIENAADIDPVAVSAHAGDLLRRNKSRSGVNHRIGACKQFTRWLHHSHRLRFDPLAGLAKLNEQSDRRRKRRALSDDEAARLLAVTRASKPWVWRVRGEGGSISGSERALLYELALGSGLRASELASLTTASFHLDDLSHASVTVDAGYSKHRREDHQPIRADLAGRLAEHLRGRAPGRPAFDMPPATKVALMLKADLDAARAAWLQEVNDNPEAWKQRRQCGFCRYCDDAGRYADFHALRHTYITRLARSGVHPSVAQKLARHGTIRLTMDHYTHTLVSDERAALATLPAIEPDDVPKAMSAKATGTDHGRADEADNVARKAQRLAQRAATNTRHRESSSGLIGSIGKDEQVERGMARKPLKKKRFGTPRHGESSSDSEKGRGGIRTHDEQAQRICNPQPEPENKRLTSTAQRQGTHPDANGDFVTTVAERLANLPAEQFHALAPRLAKLTAQDADALLRLMGV